MSADLEKIDGSEQEQNSEQISDEFEQRQDVRKQSGERQSEGIEEQGQKPGINQVRIAQSNKKNPPKQPEDKINYPPSQGSGDKQSKEIDERSNYSGNSYGRKGPNPQNQQILPSQAKDDTNDLPFSFFEILIPINTEKYLQDISEQKRKRLNLIINVVQKKKQEVEEEYNRLEHEQDDARKKLNEAQYSLPNRSRIIELLEGKLENKFNAKKSALEKEFNKLANEYDALLQEKEGKLEQMQFFFTYFERQIDNPQKFQEKDFKDCLEKKKLIQELILNQKRKFSDVYWGSLRIKQDLDSFSEELEKKYQEKCFKEFNFFDKIIEKQLTDRQLTLYHDMTIGDVSVLKKRYNIAMEKEMEQLGNGQWLASRNIDYLMCYLNEKQLMISKDNKPKHAQFQSGFHQLYQPNLNSLGGDRYLTQYSNIKSQLEAKIDNNGYSSLFDFDTWTFEINIQGQHWVSATYYVKENKIYYWDSCFLSYGHNGDPIVAGIKQIILEQAVTPEQKEMASKVQRSEKTCPQQSNGHDCGVFVTYNMLKVVHNELIDGKSYTSRDAQSFRKRLYYLTLYLETLEKGVPFNRLILDYIDDSHREVFKDIQAKLF